MNNLLASSIALVALALTSHGARAALSAGDAAPPFTAPASLDGKAFTFSLADALRRGPVVVYFYPSAYTGGCNLEAHTFAVRHDEFAAAGASIIGVSLDDIGRLNAFSADPDYCAGKIPVASDAGGRTLLIGCTSQPGSNPPPGNEPAAGTPGRTEPPPL